MTEVNSHNMEYNSSKERLIIPEYGRNVQMLIKHSKTIEDPEEKQKFVERIIYLMMQMHPQNKNMEDYREKLWKHYFRIANYENLDTVVTPEDFDRPTKETVERKPDRLEYPDSAARFRHYGKNIQIMVAKALSMDDPIKRMQYATIIGNYMKMAYRTWNREHFVSDEVILRDLETLSEGKIKLNQDTVLDTLANSNKSRKKPTNSRSNGHSKNYRGKNNNYRGKRR